MMQQQHQEHHEHHAAHRAVPVELDVNDVPVPFTRDRCVGMQHELQEALGADGFQDRLIECERTLKKSSVEFRKRHQQLVLEVQAEILPKYGFEASLQGVADMLAAVKQFCDDEEVSANTKAINELIWKPHESHHGHERRPHAEGAAHGLDWMQRWAAHHGEAGDAHPAAKQQEEGAAHGLDWMQRWAAHHGEVGDAHPAAKQQEEDAFDGRHVGVEIDMDEIAVPLTRERLLGLQQELREHFAASDFQARLRECEQVHGEGTLEFRKEHMRLVLEVQSSVLPKYGFEGSQQGVHDMMAAIRAFPKDEDVAANIKAIDGLIWRSGHAPDAKAVAQKREV